MSSSRSIPKLTVKIGDTTLSNSAISRLEELMVSLSLSQPGLCELTFLMPEVMPWPEIGMGLQVSLTDTNEDLFQGEIAALEYSLRSTGECLLFVRGYDPLIQLRRQHRTRSWPLTSAHALARELCSALGLSVAADGSSPTYPWMIQAEESDFDFLASVAEESGLYLALPKGVLSLVSLRGTGDEIALRPDDNLLDVTVEANETFASNGVTSDGWDTSRVERHSAEALAHDGLPQPGGTMAALIRNRNNPTEEIAQARASAELDRRRSRSRSVRGTAEGSVALLPGSRIRVEGMPPSLPSCFTLTQVTHYINARTGFVTNFNSDPPARIRNADAASVAWGIVTSIQDPAGLGRVRVSLPALDEVETDWIEVLAMGAGSGKGLVSLPDVNDKVVVLFPRGDLGNGIILGGLYGADGPGDYGVEDKVVRYALLTPGGNKLRFDDSRKSLRLEDAGGSYLEFTPEETTLHSKVDLRVEAPGRAMTISAQHVDFRRS